MTRTFSLFSVAAASLLVIGGFESAAHAAGPGEQAVAEAADSNQFAFVLFHRGEDAATRAMHGNIEMVVERRGRSVLVPIHVGDANEQTLIDRFDATRVPLPATAVLAPNGAVCGVYPMRVTPQQLAASIVSLGQASCLKALQDGKIVLLCVQPELGVTVPAGVQAFQRDPLYAGRTEVVSVKSQDPAEAGFLKQLRVPTDRKASVVAFMAPPGVMMGVYDDRVTLETLAGKLAAAGKCCDDESCKHHQSTAGQNRSRR